MRADQYIVLANQNLHISCDKMTGLDPNLETQGCKAITTFFRPRLALMKSALQTHPLTLNLQAALSLIILFFEILSPCLILRYILNGLFFYCRIQRVLITTLTVMGGLGAD